MTVSPAAFVVIVALAPLRANFLAFEGSLSAGTVTVVTAVEPSTSCV